MSTSSVQIASFDKGNRKVGVSRRSRNPEVFSARAVDEVLAKERW